MTHRLRSIIVTDIFGVTPAVESFGASLTASGAVAIILDPYQGIERKFHHEAAAYEAFVSECGHDGYHGMVSTALDASTLQTLVIGFSAGASAAWRAVSKDGERGIRHFVGFYPSQIRHALDLNPTCPTTLVFPMREAHFDVKPVMEKLSSKPMVACIQTSFGHGFMNPLSVNYCRGAYEVYGNVLGDAKF